nr:hypothetical protein [Tanacetum cinerariifolium]
MVCNVYTVSTSSWYPVENHWLPRETVRIRKRSGQAVLGRFIYWVGYEKILGDDGTFSVGDIVLLCGWDLAVDGASVTSFSMLFSIPPMHSVKLIGFTNNDAPIVEVDELGSGYLVIAVYGYAYFYTAWHMASRWMLEIDDAEVQADEDDSEVPAAPTPPSTTLATTPPPPQQEPIPSPPQAQSAKPLLPPQQQPFQTADISMSLLNTLLETCATLTQKEDASKQGGITELDTDEDVTLEDVDVEVKIDDTDEVEHAEVEEVIKVVTATKLITKVVTTDAPITTDAQVPKTSALRKRKGVVIQDPKETAAALVIMHSKDDVMEQVKRRERQNNTVMRYQALKRKPEIEEEGSKRKCKSLKQDTTKRQRIEEEAEELKRHLQIVANDDGDVFTEATPLASKLILLVEKKYPLTHFSLEQMLDNVRLEVEEKSEMLLELMRLVKRQLTKGYVPE